MFCGYFPKEFAMSVRSMLVWVLLVAVVGSVTVGCTRPTGPKKGLSTTTGR